MEKKKGKWFSRIPKEVLLSPGGFILIFLAIIMELIDLIPIPFVDQLWEIPIELVFILFLTVITKAPIKSAIVPFIIERIPGISDVVPTWLIRLLG